MARPSAMLSSGARAGCGILKPSHFEMHSSFFSSFTLLPVLATDLSHIVDYAESNVSERAFDSSRCEYRLGAYWMWRSSYWKEKHGWRGGEGGEEASDG